MRTTNDEYGDSDYIRSHLHLWQPLPTGKVGIVKGPMMAQPDAFSVIIKGKGGHGSMPQQTVDPILVASQVVVNAQSIVSRNIDPLKPAVVNGTCKTFGAQAEIEYSLGWEA